MPSTGPDLDIGSGLLMSDAGAACAPVMPPAAGTVELATYRGAVRDLLAEVVGQQDLGRVPWAEAFLAERMREPDFAAVLSATPNGIPEAAERLLLEVRNYRSSTQTSAADLTTLIRIFLLAQIDAAWWGRIPAFETDEEVLSSADLVDLETLRRRGLLGFQYRRQATTVLTRAARAAERRVWPWGAPRTAGLLFDRARPEVVALLNQLSAQFAKISPPGMPPLWVTSLARSVEHQNRLRALGYAATLPSSHCVGYAIDIEMSWFRRFGAHRALRAMLLERQSDGDVNVIDEGQTWHVCVSPLAAAGLRDDFENEMAG
jgi:hypothetical protein